MYACIHVYIAYIYISTSTSDLLTQIEPCLSYYKHYNIVAILPLCPDKVAFDWTI